MASHPGTAGLAPDGARFRLPSRETWTFVLLVVIGLACILLTRLPQIRSEYLEPDGDEAVVGIMAMHLLRGVDYPVFFYGQRYGVALMEAAAAALGFSVFGISGPVLKLAMLVLWSGGWVFWFAALRQSLSLRASAIAALLLIFAPAWGDWALKARGLYVTGFVLTSLATLLVGMMHSSVRSRPFCGMGLGLCLAVLVLTQPSWLIAFVPFLPFAVSAQRRVTIGRTVACAVAAVAAGGLLLLISYSRAASYMPPVFTTSINSPLALWMLPGRVWVNLTGWYYMGMSFRPPLSVAIAAVFWLAMLVYTLILFVHRRKDDAILRACALSLLGVAGLTLMMNHNLFGFRYLLPLAQYAVVPAAILADGWIGTGGRRRLVAWGALGIVALSGVLALLEFRVPPHVQGGHEFRLAPKALKAVVAELEKRGNRHVFVTVAGLQWRVIFASKGDVIARWRSETDRYQPYVDAVDDALRSGKPVAVLGLGGELDDPAKKHGCTSVDFMHEFSVVFDAPEKLVRDMYFNIRQRPAGGGESRP